MGNSSLINYTCLSPNCNKPRNHAIDTITIHHMAGDLSVERCGQLFKDPKKQGSSNYGIGSDGRIALYVNECDRAWTSGNRANDNRAITIEVANNTNKEPWTISDEAYKSLIKLLVDICQRNNIKELKWHNDKKLIGKTNLQNMTVHRWFQSTACPGTYLMTKMGDIAAEVNAALGVVADTYTIEDFRTDVRSILNATTNLEAFNKTVKISTVWNKHHTLVTPLERYFKATGYYSGKIEADEGKKPDFGSGMKSAVMAYQAANFTFKPDGVLDAKKSTWKKLLLG